MNNDRELLELAAKAAGYDTSHPWNADRLLRDPPVIGLCIKGVSTCWNTLENKGHALGLAIKLHINLDFESYEVVAETRFRGGAKAIEYPRSGTDMDALTCRAITRVAAEIGRTMK